MARKRRECYPDYTAEVAHLNAGNQITSQLLGRIIRKHRGNACFNQKLCERYQVIEEGVPIFRRRPRFSSGSQINNRLNHDYFSEIVDFKTGYFAGSPISYSYSNTEESRQVTGGERQVNEAGKVLTDFVARACMYDVDMQAVKYAAICGYGARLFYLDKSGRENVMPVFPYQAILLSSTGALHQPEYGVRYYRMRDLNNRPVCKAEFYDRRMRYRFSGSSFNTLELEEAPMPHGFGGCPLQGIPNNEELTGDAEKVISLIDAYDRCMSDSSNEIENFAQAYMVFENISISPEVLAECQQSGAFSFASGTGGKVYYLTKDINDTFLQNYCDRLEKNIFHRSKTPNLSDESFGTASGISLKFKLTELETKCGMLQAKMQAAGMYMFQLLSFSWQERLKTTVVPEQCIMEFSRNFPLDALSEAQAAQTMIASGLPKRIAYANAYSFIDDVDYVMELAAKEENDGLLSLYASGNGKQEA